MSSLFDVVVTDGVKIGTFRHGISKSDAKKIVKELKKKGYKAQLVTNKGRQVEMVTIDTEATEDDEETRG